MYRKEYQTCRTLHLSPLAAGTSGSAVQIDIQDAEKKCIGVLILGMEGDGRTVGFPYD